MPPPGIIKNFYAAGFGNNVVTANNGYGVYAYISSNVFLGNTSSGHNSIYDNSSYEVSAKYSSIVSAENNWWNRPSPPYYLASDFTTYGGGSIDYIPSLSYDPNAGLLKIPNGTSDMVKGYDNDPASFLNDDLITALYDKIEKKYEEATQIYIEKLNKSNDKNEQKYLLTELAECYRFMDDEGKNRFNQLNIHKKLDKKEALYALTLELENYWNLKNGDYDKAIKNLEEILQTFDKDKEKVKQTLFNLGQIYFTHIKDAKKAEEYFNQLEELSPNDQLVYDSKLLLNESVENFDLYSNQFKKPSEENILPSDHFLTDNYPNPFNSSTTITYKLPNDGKVQIKIFDMLGREVVMLLDEFKSAGQYTVDWDGSREASGTYIYSIIFRGSTLQKKILLLK